MTDARDELAALIRDTVHAGTRRVNWEDIADAILAAGWVKPSSTSGTSSAPTSSSIPPNRIKWCVTT